MDQQNAVLITSGSNAVVPFGLVECAEMDKDLSRIASVKFRDVPLQILQETLQCVDLLKLLRLRRVCTQWRSTISNASRQVTFDITALRKTYTISNLKDHLKKYNIWEYVTTASTILFYESSPDYNSSPFFGYPQHVLLCAYIGQTINDERARLVNKVIFVNAFLSTEILCEILNFPIKFQLVFYQSSVKVWAADLIDFTECIPWDHFEWNEPLEESILPVKLGPGDWFILSDSHRQFINTQVDGNTTLDRIIEVIIQNAAPLSKNEVTELDTVIKAFEFPDDLLIILEYLLKRYPSKTGQAMEHYITGDLPTFAAVTHPLVLVLLRHFISTVQTFLDNPENFDSDDDDAHSANCFCRECAGNSEDNDDGGESWEDCTADDTDVT